MDYKDYIAMAILATVLFIAEQLLAGNKSALLREVERLIQEAETAIQGSHMGELKKRWVIDQLEAAGTRVTKWLSLQIDIIVKALNARGAWLATQARQSKLREPRQ